MTDQQSASVDTPTQGATDVQPTTDSVNDEVVDNKVVDEGGEKTGSEAETQEPQKEWHESVTPEQFEEMKQAHENSSKWKAANTQKAQELAAEKAAIDQQKAELEQSRFEKEERARLSQKINEKWDYLGEEEKALLVDQELELSLKEQKLKEYEQTESDRQKQEDLKSLNEEFKTEIDAISSKYQITDTEALKRIENNIKYSLYTSPDVAGFSIKDAADKEAQYWISLLNNKNKEILDQHQKDKAHPVEGAGGTAPSQNQRKMMTFDDIINKHWNN